MQGRQPEVGVGGLSWVSDYLWDTKQVSHLSTPSHLRTGEETPVSRAPGGWEQEAQVFP